MFSKEVSVTTFLVSSQIWRLSELMNEPSKTLGLQRKMDDSQLILHTVIKCLMIFMMPLEGSTVIDNSFLAQLCYLAKLVIPW